MASGATGHDDLGEVFDIRDEEIDVAAIMAEIRARLRERPPLEVDLDALVFRPGGSAFDSVEEEVRYYLEQARAANDRLLVGEQLRAQRTRPLDPVRGAFHQLVQYYVDALAQRQQAVNADVLNALAALVHRVAALAEEQQQIIALLRRELAHVPPTASEASGPTGGAARSVRQRVVAAIVGDGAPVHRYPVVFAPSLGGGRSSWPSAWLPYCSARGTRWPC